MNLEQIFTEKGWFPMLGKINKEMRENFERYVAKHESGIKILFRTNGGNLFETLRIVDMLHFHQNIIKTKVQAFVLGECSSAGITILSQCSKELREASPNAQFMFHSATITPEYKHNLGLENAIAAMRKEWGMAEKAVSIEAEAFNLSKEKIMELRIFGEDNNYALTSEEAKELGIITAIKEVPEL